MITRRNDWVLMCTAIFAALWVLARAHVQAITIDEADTYLTWVGLPWPSHWRSAANNHVLNSVLMRISTSVFGVSHLSVRAPAILGALIYMSDVLLLCITVIDNARLRWAVLVCMLYNPFIVDYLVAARGYGLALAFLMSCIAIPCWYHFRSPNPQVMELTTVCSLCSIAAALSFSANFSFAVIDGLTLLAVFIWACWFREQELRPVDTSTKINSRSRLLAACTLPGLVMTVFLCGSVLRDWRSIELVYGARSLPETLKSVVSASRYELNPFIVNPLIYGVIQKIQLIVMPRLFVIVSAGQVILLLLQWKTLKGARDDKRMLVLAGGLMAILVLALLVHRLAFRLMHVLLPKDRTALYIAPFATLIAGCIAAVQLPSRIGALFRRTLMLVLFGVGVLFLMSMRVKYFKEWKYDADVQQIYAVIAYYNHSYGVKDVPTHWSYSATLNFYNVMSGHEGFNKFVGTTPYPDDKKVYVLYYPDDEAFINAHRLKVIYHGDLSDAVVAIDPILEKGVGLPQR